MAYCKTCGNTLPPEAKYCPRCGAAVTPEEVPVAQVQAAVSAGGLKQATWGERFVAWLIDIAIIDSALLIISALIYLGHPFALLRNEGWWSVVFNFNSSGVIFFLYWMLMDAAYGKSIGKIIMRLRVTRLDGKPVSFGQAALESVGKAFLLPLDFLLGWALYPRRRQRIFNYLSETIVVRE
jgi:uncharacterized RDD family membrane protein YckC